LFEVIPSGVFGLEVLKMISLKNVKAALVVFMLCFPCLGLSQGAGGMESRSSLRAGAIKAAYTACEKFSVAINREKNYGELGKFLSDINNYDVTIEPEKGGYAVSFLPLPYEGEAIAGGGAVYHIDGVTYQIISERHYK
jgi:hypothetical protein